MMIKKQIGFFLILSLVCFSNIFSQAIPKRPEPPKLVNDLVGLYTAEEVNALENKLIAVDDSTSVQIAVVVLPELYGYDINSLAFEIAEKWGVGQKGKNNGVVILIKPKNGNERGFVSIQVGYGLESAITDALSKRIIQLEMIPEFQKNNAYAATDKAINAIILASKGMYKPEAKKSAKSRRMGIAFMIMIIIIVIISIFNKNNRSNHKTLGKNSNLPLWMLLGMGMSGRSSGSGWGNFSSGGGSFGGFGGGSFGGGGASGSW